MIGVSDEGADAEDLEGDSGAFVDVAELGCGMSVEVVELFKGVPAEAAGGGLDGVFAADGVGVEVAGCWEKLRLSLISPYSFHSSTSGRSYVLQLGSDPSR